MRLIPFDIEINSAPIGISRIFIAHILREKRQYGTLFLKDCPLSDARKAKEERTEELLEDLTNQALEVEESSDEEEDNDVDN